MLRQEHTHWERIRQTNCHIAHYTLTSMDLADSDPLHHALSTQGVMIGRHNRMLYKIIESLQGLSLNMVHLTVPSFEPFCQVFSKLDLYNVKHLSRIRGVELKIAFNIPLGHRVIGDSMKAVEGPALGFIFW